MPWKETNMVEERMKFIARYCGGEKVTVLCAEFGISRKTGHKIIRRYREQGLSGLYSRSSICGHNRKTTPLGIQKMIVELKNEYPAWGAPKIGEIFKKKHPDVKCPVISTIHAILDKNGFVKHRSTRSRYRATGTNLRSTAAPNDLWSIDYKGQFLLGNQRYCYPLTISDHFSRYLLCCEGLSGTRTDEAFGVFEETFKENGLPAAIRSDNGVPFSARSLFNLSKLSVWWIRLGIKIERIQPGCPQQNGRHERMHKTLKLETEAKRNFLQQQEVFDEFVHKYNHVRPHEALKMKVPGEIYKKSDKSYPKYLTDPAYPGADKVATVTGCGSISIGKGTKIFLSESFASQPVGLYRQDEGIWLLKFMDYELGFFDDQSFRFTPGENPFINPLLL